MARLSQKYPSFLEKTYQAAERAAWALNPLVAKIGYGRVERLIKPAEDFAKERIFGCHHCGQCILHSTGMSCPMECPKNLRNGPCGGVRADGNCEVIPAMRCVWIEAHEGNLRIGKPNRHGTVHTALDNRLWGRSSWLRIAREHAKRASV